MAELPGPTEHFGLQFTLPAVNRPDVTLRIEASATLEEDSWQVVASKKGEGPWSDPAMVEQTVQADGTVVVTVRSPWTPAEELRAFLRLEGSLD
jgi:hypothetical protein